MAQEAHSSESHNEAGFLGGLLDGTAVGLGAGLVIGGICLKGDWITAQAWVQMTAATTVVGVILGTWWGKNRGY